MGMEEEECGASPGRAKRREGAREGLGGGHGVSSGMPGTQLCAWLPGEGDRREEKAWEGQVATRASSTCSASSVAFHRAAWRRGEGEEDPLAPLGRVGWMGSPRLGAR